jgi:hypothetical protein
MREHAEPPGQLGRRRQHEPAPASRIRCLARPIRCAMVASGTRNAAATWAVLSPPTHRPQRQRESRRRRQHRMATLEQQHQRIVIARSGVGRLGDGNGLTGSNAAVTSRRRRALSVRQ